jgi:hypothetical protein
MKPEGWDQMTDEDKMNAALNLMQSVRGQYIIGQALRVASEAMGSERLPETSNIQDMEMLGETLFQLGWSVLR